LDRCVAEVNVVDVAAILDPVHLVNTAHDYVADPSAAAVLIDDR
jgi:hypothetical protein